MLSGIRLTLRAQRSLPVAAVPRAAAAMCSKSLAEPIGPITPKLLSEDQVERVFQRDEELRGSYMDLTDKVPESSLVDGKDMSYGEVLRKRIIYRSKQRGWLEVDLLLGSWAEENVMDLSDEEVAQYVEILELETVDTYNYLTGRDSLPEELNTPIMRRLMEYAASSPLGKASPDAYAAKKNVFSN